MNVRTLGLRVIWCVLLLMVFLEHGRQALLLLNLWRNPAQDTPYMFYLGGSPDRVRGMWIPVRDAGLRSGDRLVAIDGEPFQGHYSLSKAFARGSVGRQMAVDVERKGTPRQIRFALASVDRTSEVEANLLFLAVLLPLSLVIGFGVTWLRPFDLRSWVLLALMVSLLPMFNLIDFPVESRFTYYIHRLMNGCAMNTWPVWMGLLGILFPDRLPFTRYRLAAFSVAVVPNIVLTALVVAYELACVEWLSVARTMFPLVERMLQTIRYAHLVSIGFFFAAIAIQRAVAPTPEARRRAVLVNWGAHLSMAPMFALVVRSMILGQDVLRGVPGFVSLFALASLGLFPLVLAYVVIVHRAMDIRVVLRTGMQYAFATKAVRAMQLFLSFALIFNAGRLLSQEETRPQRIMMIAAAVMGVALLRLGSQKLRATVDRRFFREAYDAEQVLSELSEEVRTMVESRPLLETVSRKISAAMHVPRVAILTCENGAFHPAFAVGFEAIPEAAIPASGAILARLKAQPQGITTYLDDPKSWILTEVPAEEVKNLQLLETQLLLPLAAKDELVGVMSLGPKRSEEPYSRTDLQLLRSVALQTGLALENSRLTSAVAEQAAQRERLNREMEIARDVQTRLFPQRLPAIPGLDYWGNCRPAASIGGDYYDFFETPHRQLGIAIGDVSGKGVPAALLMAVLHASVRGQAMHTEDNLATLIGNVNRLIYDASAKSHFATLFYAQYDAVARKLVYVNAGHNPPVLLSASGTVEWLGPTGPGAGLTKLSRYTHRELTLEPGDLLVAYTDGFTESMNKENEEYGEERLLAAIQRLRTSSPAAMIAGLMESADGFVAGAPQHDDMTAIVLKLS